MNHLKESGIIIVFFLIIMAGLFSSYHNSDITGKVVSQITSTRVNISSVKPFVCEIELKKGLNTMSFPCISSYTPRTEFFDNVENGTNNTYAIYEYKGDSSDPWKVYNPNLPSYVVQDLNYLDRSKGYIIIMNKSDFLNYSGFLPDAPSVTTKNGWALVGYPSNKTKILPSGLTSINDSFLVIETYYNNDSGKNGYYSYYNDGSGNLTSLETYHGYWINSTASDNWDLN